ARGFGPGFNGPLVLAAELPSSGATSGLTAFETALRATPGVAFASPPRFNADHSTAVIIAYPTTAPEAAATARLVTTLRHDVIPRTTAGTGATVLVGGQTAAG